MALRTDYAPGEANPSGALNTTNTQVNKLELVAVNPQTGNYVLAASDNNVAVEVNSASAAVVTLPLNATVPIPVGFVSEIMWHPSGAGQVSVAGAGGTTVTAVRGTKVAIAGASLTVRKRGTDSWVVGGDVTT